MPVQGSWGRRGGKERWRKEDETGARQWLSTAVAPEIESGSGGESGKHDEKEKEEEEGLGLPAVVRRGRRPIRAPPSGAR